MTKPRAIYCRNHLLVLVCVRAGHLARKSLTSDTSLTVVPGYIKRQYEAFVVSRLLPSIGAGGYGGVHPAIIGSCFEPVLADITSTITVE
jgi:hypothetical protein